MLCCEIGTCDLREDRQCPYKKGMRAKGDGRDFLQLSLSHTPSAFYSSFFTGMNIKDGGTDIHSIFLVRDIVIYLPRPVPYFFQNLT